MHCTRANSASIERGERPRQRGLAHARVVLDQHVALGEQGDHDVRSAPSGTFTAREMFSDNRWARAATAGGSSSGTLAIRRRSYDEWLRSPSAVCRISSRRPLRSRRVRSRQATSGSAARISVSPTSTASTPTRSSSSTCSRRADARLRHDGLAGRARRRAGRTCARGRRVKSVEVAVVDADHVGVELERALQLLLVVDLDERVEVERLGLAVERAPARRP